MKQQRRTKQQEIDIEWHLDDPRTRKWIVQCVICQAMGYPPDAPKNFFGREHLVAYFQPLDLNEAGICVDCQQALDEANSHSKESSM